MGEVLSVGLRRAALVTMLLSTLPAALRAQEGEGAAPDTASATDESADNTIAGEFTPAKGFDLVKTSKGSLNVSAYGLFRYVNQMPGEQTFEDHLGRERTVKARNDLNWHRTFVWLTGFFWKPQFRYNISLWSLPTTQQSLLFGNLQYRVARPLNIGVGMAPNLTARSLQGSWPFWASSDRQMSEEFFRGGFSSGVWVNGEPIKRVFYTASVNSNISQLGVTASNDTRDFAYSASLYTMPTTGEYGLRGGLEDFENHQRVATRFGMSTARSRESRYADDSVPPNATQIKLSDGVNPFDTGALADGVTVQKLTYGVVAADFGVKYRGAALQGEAYFRRLSNFATDLPLPGDVPDDLDDRGFQLQASYMVLPRTLSLDAAYGYVDDEFGRKPWELSGSTSFYPSGTRSWRLNLHVIHIEQSPTSSNFGFYTSGQTGTTISIGTDILL